MISLGNVLVRVAWFLPVQESLLTHTRPTLTHQVVRGLLCRGGGGYNNDVPYNYSTRKIDVFAGQIKFINLYAIMNTV